MFCTSKKCFSLTDEASIGSFSKKIELELTSKASLKFLQLRFFAPEKKLFRAPTFSSPSSLSSEIPAKLRQCRYAKSAMRKKPEKNLLFCCCGPSRVGVGAVVVVVVGGAVVDVPAEVAEGVVVVEADVTPILFPKPHDGSSEN